MEVTIKINGQALSVEVSVEVYECLDRADHKEENLTHEKRRHWDIREFDEYIVATEGSGYQETPEEWVCHRETRDELLSVLESRTTTQRRRFLLYALDGLTYEQIARLDGCSKAAIQDSIEVVRKNSENFSNTYPTKRLFRANQVRETIPITGRDKRFCAACPSCISGGRPTTVINLRRYYYPLVKTDTFMEVPEEVAEALLQRICGRPFPFSLRHRPAAYTPALCWK